jgi:hypothetical protein
MLVAFIFMLAVYKAKEAESAAREVLCKSSLTISAKPGGVGAASQPVGSRGRTIFVADAHRGDGKGFVVRADEKLTAFLELEAAVRACGELA